MKWEDVIWRDIVEAFCVCEANWTSQTYSHLIFPLELW